MAHVVDNLPSPRGFTGARYPWDDWLNGEVWLIEPGDYNGINRDSFIGRAHVAASRRGLKVRTRRGDNGRVVFIQAFKDGDDG